MKISTSYSSNKKNSLSLSLYLKKDKHVIQQHVLYYGLLRNSRAKKEKKSINSFPPRLVDASSEREVASVSTRPCPRVPPSTSCGPHLSYPPREGAVQNQPASPASLEGKRRKEEKKKENSVHAVHSPPRVPPAPTAVESAREVGPTWRRGSSEPRLCTRDLLPRGLNHHPTINTRRREGLPFSASSFGWFRFGIPIHFVSLPRLVVERNREEREGEERCRFSGGGDLFLLPEGSRSICDEEERGIVTLFPRKL